MPSYERSMNTPTTTTLVVCILHYSSKTMSLSSILYILKNHQFLVSSCIGIYELSRAFFPRKQSNTGYLTYYQSLKRLVRTPFSKSRRTSAPKICQINVFSCILYIETIHYEYSSSRLWIVPTALTSNPTFVFVFFSLFEYITGVDS